MATAPTDPARREPPGAPAGASKDRSAPSPGSDPTPGHGRRTGLGPSKGAAVRGRLPHDGRTQRAVATRARITAAARVLFVRDGYAATSVKAVAREAHVGEQTVYYSYPTKAELLVGCLDHAVDGADRVPGGALADLTRLPWVHGALAEPDPAQRLFLHVRGMAELLGRSGPILDVLRGVPDDAVAQAWRLDEERRRGVHRLLVASYLPAAGGRGHTLLDEAVDIATVVLGPETWNALVGRSGWSTLAWARWAHRTLLAELLPEHAEVTGHAARTPRLGP